MLPDGGAASSRRKQHLLSYLSGIYESFLKLTVFAYVCIRSLLQMVVAPGIRSVLEIAELNFYLKRTFCLYNSTVMAL